MSRLVARILLSMLLFPLASLFYTFVVFVTEAILERHGVYYYIDQGTLLFVVAGTATWLLVAVYWCLLWRSSVTWRSRRMATLLIAAGSIILGAAGGLSTDRILDGRDSGFGAFIGSVLTIILWVIASVFVWRETNAERAARIKSSGKSAITCPTCGYNLTGLSEARCPECGNRFTLDELLALQPGAEAEIE